MGTYSYRRSEDIIVIEIRDGSGAKIDRWTIPINNKKRYSEVLEYLKEKYGISPEIDLKDSINAKQEEIDWWA